MFFKVPIETLVTHPLGKGADTQFQGEHLNG
jgi:hypothetical protein